VFVRPHFQMEELTASIRMVAELPAPAAWSLARLILADPSWSRPIF